MHTAKYHLKQSPYSGVSPFARDAAWTVRVSPATFRRTRKKHEKMLSYDGRCHPACSLGPFYGCLARERLEQVAVALLYPHNRRGSALVFYHGRRPKLFASQASKPARGPCRDEWLRGYRAHLRNFNFTGREDMKMC